MSSRDRERGMRLKSCRRKIIQQCSGKGKGSLGVLGGCPEDNTDSEGVSPGIMEGNVLASERLRNAQPLS